MTGMVNEPLAAAFVFTRAQVASGAPAIARAAYDEDVSAADIVEPARRWVKVHRA